MGRDVSSIISAGMVVMSETSAGINHAQAGDILDLVAANGSIVQFIVGRVAPDAEVGGAEIVMSTAQADDLGATLPTSVLIYGQFDRSRLDAALTAAASAPIRRSVCAGRGTRFDPDDTIGVARTKKLLGEFAYHVTTGDNVAVDDAWRAAYIPNREPYPTGIVAACNNSIKADLAAALQEVVDSGLGGLIDRHQHEHLRRVLRPAVLAGSSAPSWVRCHGTRGGRPSTPTLRANCQGCVPKMDCRDRAHLPQAQLRVGWQLPVPRRHALRVGRRAAQHLPVPLALLPQRAERGDRVLARSPVGDRARQPGNAVRRQRLGAHRRLSAASLPSRWQLDS